MMIIDKSMSVPCVCSTGSSSAAVFTKQSGASNPFNDVDVGDDAAPWCGVILFSLLCYALSRSSLYNSLGFIVCFIV